ncbi:MAG: hypothetical protein J6T01_06195, partial [Kiritimatiellae bacterium]|nr:hypothetical protein [Kiritimatiellia bacterium]
AGNAVRCVWAGDKPGAAARMPFNAPFQFAVAGDRRSVGAVQKTLDAVCEAMPAALLDELKRLHLLAPTLQWLVRRSMPGAADPNIYLRGSSHPPAFAEKDFNATNLTEFAARLHEGLIPPAVVLSRQDEMYRTFPAPPAAAGVDYPGFLSETVYATPFGFGIVLRAPQSVRIFRFRATAHPRSKMKPSYKCVVTGGNARVMDWQRGKRAADGYIAVRIDARGIKRNRRVEVAVFARSGNGPWGAPSVISFFTSPYEERTYAKDGRVQSIRYLPAVKDPPPYDISACCLPADWTDYYSYDEKGRILGFSRAVPLFPKAEEFSNLGEVVLERHPNDTPKVSRKVRYFERDGKMAFEETGEEITHPLAPFSPRLRGE